MAATLGLAQANARILPHSEERRRFQRVKVNLLGRYMLADRREFGAGLLLIKLFSNAELVERHRKKLRLGLSPSWQR